MEYIQLRVLRYSFNSICVITLFCMAGYWIWKFAIDDRDIGIVDYVEYGKELDIELFAVTFCFKNAFLKDQMESIQPEINQTSYLQYLRGDFMNSRLRDIEYENITMNLGKYFLRGSYGLSNETIYRNGTFRHKTNFNGYITGWDGIFKCFEVTLNMPHIGYVRSIFLEYDVKRLLNDTSSDFVNPTVRCHYPGQHLLTLSGAMFNTGGIYSGRILTAYTKDVEIIKGRNSRKRSCTPYNDIVSFDDMVREKQARINGCTPPYVQTVLGVPKCSTKDEIKQFLYDWDSLIGKNYPPCCKRVSKLALTLKGSKSNYEIFRLKIFYPRYAKIIIQSKDVDTHALIGNIGGYVGLFLGIMMSSIFTANCLIIIFSGQHIQSTNIITKTYNFRICHYSNTRFLAKSLCLH